MGTRLQPIWPRTGFGDDLAPGDIRVPEYSPPGALPWPRLWTVEILADCEYSTHRLTFAAWGRTSAEAVAAAKRDAVRALGVPAAAAAGRLRLGSVVPAHV